MRLTERQRKQLQAAAIFGSEYVNKIAETIQRENPNAFWSESNWYERNFYHQPRTSEGCVLPCKSFVQPTIRGLK